MRYSILLSLLIGFATHDASAAYSGAEFRVVKGKDVEVCSFAVKVLREAEDLFPVRLEALFGKWDWQERSYHWVSATMNGQFGGLFAQYDIDNDGTDETILRRSWMRQSHENIALFIFESGTIDFRKDPRLTYDQLKEIPRVASDASLPYWKHGLVFLKTAPFVHDSENYLVIMDELFGRAGFSTRKLVVAKYAGVAIEGTTENRTDRLNIVCEIVPVRPFLPYSQ